MTLAGAHKWYAYQDLISAYFVLDEILKRKNSVFIFDTKEYSEDKFDDLTIKNEAGIRKIQFKHSDDINLDKNFLASDWDYDLWLGSLYNSYIKHPSQKKLSELRICTTWNEPEVWWKILDFIFEDQSSNKTFASSLLYKVDLSKIWPEDGGVDSSWRRLGTTLVQELVQRDSFGEFLTKLVIEIRLPQFSLDINNPWALEIQVLKQVERLWIWTYPYEEVSQNEVFFKLKEYINRKRSTIDTGLEFSVKEITQELWIRNDYGSIEQTFPIDQTKNISSEDFIRELVESSHRKIYVKWSPWSGKSWLVQNLEAYLREANHLCIRHYCYVSIDDILAEERIKSNTLFWNLINDILQQRPELERYKEVVYASSLSELNLILAQITEKTFILIDWLDHIKRVFDQSGGRIAESETDIIENLKGLILPENIKLIIFSQPLWNLDEFAVITVPDWDKTKIDELLLRNKIPAQSDLSDFILEKSSWNALYIKYLVDEFLIKGDLRNFPPYAWDISTYYEYVMGNLNIKDRVVYALCWSDFRLDTDDLICVTGEGEGVSETLELIAPILNVNASQSGYIIYHESFRRFIIESLERKKYSINQNLYQPLIEWLKSKWFFEFSKSYRNLLSLLVKTNQHSMGLEYANREFVLKSLQHGHPLPLIKSNQRLLAKCVVVERDFPRLMYIVENARIIWSVLEHEFKIEGYLEALGEVKWQQSVKDYIEFEWKPMMDLMEWFQACYSLDKHGEAAPWGAYLGLWKNSREDSKNNEADYIEYYFRYLLSSNDEKELLKVCKIITRGRHANYAKKLLREIDCFAKEGRFQWESTRSISKNKTLRRLCRLNIKVPENVDESAERLLKMDYLSKESDGILRAFFKKVARVKDKGKIESLKKVFEWRNWFFNWIIYYIEILQISKTSNQFADIKKAFEFLIKDLEPFKWSPRTVDLHWVEDFILESIDEGLSLMENKEALEWGVILSYLTLVTNKVGVYLYNASTWVLTTLKKANLLKLHLNEANIEHILASLTSDISDNTRTYSELAESNFELATLYSKSWRPTEAKKAFDEGILFSISNGYRKDTTLTELIDPLFDICRLDKNKWDSYLKELFILWKTVQEYTENWKGIRWLTLNWYNEYLKVNRSEAALFLLNRLASIESGYHWLLEKKILSFLKSSNGEYDPLVEIFLAKTLLDTENEEDDLNCFLNIFEKVLPLDKKIAIDFLGIIDHKATLEKNWNKREDSVAFTNRLNFLLDEHWIVTEGANTHNGQTSSFAYREELTLSDEIDRGFWVGMTPIGNKSISEITEYLKQVRFLSECDLLWIGYKIDSTQFNEEVEDLISTLVSRNEWVLNRYGLTHNKLEIWKVFKEWTEQYFYYKIALFNHKSWGWGECFIDITSFVEAANNNFQRAKNDFFEISGRKYYATGYSSWIWSNLVKAISLVPGQEDLALDMYKSLYDIISYRIPRKVEFDWGEWLSNSEDLNTEEVLICMLFTRLRIGSSERYHIAIWGITYLLYHSPEKLKKPLKWFFKNTLSFNYTTKQIILEMLLDYKKSTNEAYPDNFKTEIIGLYPSKEYSVDYIIEQFNFT